MEIIYEIKRGIRSNVKNGYLMFDNFYQQELKGTVPELVQTFGIQSIENFRTDKHF